MRITTRAIMQGYNFDLNKALNNWNKAQNTVLTQRNFNTIAEDPSGATRSFKLRQQFRTNNMQLEMAQQANSLLDQASSSAMQISDILCNTVNKDVISAANATNLAPDIRKAYAESLRGMRDSIVLAANSQISGRYVFGGASTKEVPFEMDADGNLTYRGINVDATDADLYTTENGEYVFLKESGEILVNGENYDPNKTVKTITFYDENDNEINTYQAVGEGELTSIYDQTIKLTYDADGKPVGLKDRNGNDITEYATEVTEYSLKDSDDNTVNPTATITRDADGNVTKSEHILTQKGTLDRLAEESLYLDLGFGLESDANGNTVSTSAFNTAIPGINILGYGKDENGMSNNVVVLLGQLADALESESFSEEYYGKLMDKFGDCIDEVTDFESSLGTKQKFVDGTVTRLEQYNDSINTRIVDVERVDMEEAISTYTWMGYAYNAALKVGTNIVSNSLLDYMK